MREIKFRGKDIDGNWVYGCLVRYSDSVSYIASDIIEKPMELVSTDTVGLFTGLTDKNGKEVFEGDVVYIAGLGNTEIKFPFIDLYEASTENDIGEIIGNIYKNHDLLTNN